MALQIIDYSKIPAKSSDLSGLTDIFENALKGYEIAKEPQKMGQEQQARELANALASIKAKYAEPLAQSQLSLNSARMQRALRPSMEGLSSLEKAISGAERIKVAYGQDSPQAKLADAFVQRLAQGANGTQLTIDPETKAITFSQGGYGRNQPMTQIVDGNLISRPTTPTSTAQQKSAVANQAREYIAQDSEQPYLGSGSNIQLTKDRFDYTEEKDPIKKAQIGQRLVQAAVAAKMAPEYAALQLLAQGTTPSVTTLKEQERAIKQGWPESLDLVVNNLPKELQKQAQELHNEKIKGLNEARSRFFAEGLPISLKKNENNTNKNSFIRIKSPSGAIKLIPESQVEAALKAGGSRA